MTNYKETVHMNRLQQTLLILFVVMATLITTTNANAASTFTVSSSSQSAIDVQHYNGTLEKVAIGRSVSSVYRYYIPGRACASGTTNGGSTWTVAGPAWRIAGDSNDWLRVRIFWGCA
jgi:hypothetical protein